MERACDHAAIRAVLERWFRAMEEGDVAGVVALVTPDVVVIPPGSPPIEGKSGLEEALSAFLGENSETVDYEVAEVEVSDGLAFARIAESTTILPRTGADPFSVKGTHITVLRRQPDGNWLIARDISSLIGAQ